MTMMLKVTTSWPSFHCWSWRRWWRWWSTTPNHWKDAPWLREVLQQLHNLFCLFHFHFLQVTFKLFFTSADRVDSTWWNLSKKCKTICSDSRSYKHSTICLRWQRWSMTMTSVLWSWRRWWSSMNDAIFQGRLCLPLRRVVMTIYSYSRPIWIYLRDEIIYI